MRIHTKTMGELDIDERQILDFPQGILGFETHHTWALIDSEQAPFYWLQNLENPDLAFVLIEPGIFRKDFVVDLSDQDREALQFPEPEATIVFAIVTIPEDQNRMSANLQGPIVVNKKFRVGRQTIQIDQRWRVRHFIIEELKAGNPEKVV